MKSRFRSNAVTKEETEDTLLRAMLYEPFPGNAAVVLSRLGFLGNGLVDGVGAGLGARTFDAESGRLSLTMDDGRVVELARAVHPHIENRYAVSVHSREGVVVDRGFVLIDRDSNGKDVGVTDLLNHRVAYAEAESGTFEGQEFPDGSADFEPGTEDEVRVEETETGQEPVVMEAARVEAEPENKAEENLPVLADEQTEKDEQSEEMTAEAEGHDLPYGDTPEEEDPSAVEKEVEPEMQSVESQIYSEPEIAVEAEESGIDKEPEAIEPLEASVEEVASGASEVEAGTIEVQAVEEQEAEPEIHTEIPEPGAALQEPSVDKAEPDVEAEAEVEEVAATPEMVRKVSDRERYYGPLFQALEANEAVMFGWVAETGTIQTYEHKETGRYLHLDGASGLFYDQRRTPISKSAALRHAMRPLVVVEAPTVVEEEAVAVAVPDAGPASGPALSAAARVKPQVENVGTGVELGLDAFMRKAEEPVAREGGRESWKSRFAGLGRALKLKRNGHEGVKDASGDEKDEG